MVPLNWVARQWAPVNKWGSTLSWNKVDNAVQKAIMNMVGISYANEIKCEFGVVVALFSKIACTNDGRSGCWDDYSQTRAAKSQAFSGAATSVPSANVNISVSEDTLSGEQDNAMIQADVLSSHQ